MPTLPTHRQFCVAILLCICSLSPASADEKIPHAQDRPPGPALSPQEAIAKMTVPDGFSVELIADRKSTRLNSSH